MFAGLYAALYPGVRRPLRPIGRTNAKTRSPAGPETFTLPGRGERLVAPQPVRETARIVAANSKSMPLNHPGKGHAVRLDTLTCGHPDGGSTDHLRYT
jgi:hypothetical protein